jgi:chromosome segregation ATPase
MSSRALAIQSPTRPQARGDIRVLRRDAERRYAETDLLVAALNDHIRDLRAERDRLARDLEEARAKLDQALAQSRRLTDAWFLHGHKGIRPAR